MTSQETLCAVLSALDFTPDYVCESAIERTAHEAQWLVVQSCGCAPVLCTATLARMQRIQVQYPLTNFCGACKTVSVRTISYTQIGG